MFWFLLLFFFHPSLTTFILSVDIKLCFPYSVFYMISNKIRNKVFYVLPPSSPYILIPDIKICIHDCISHINKLPYVLHVRILSFIRVVGKFPSYLCFNCFNSKSLKHHTLFLLWWDCGRVSLWQQKTVVRENSQQSQSTGCWGLVWTPFP